jgi:uncharacterized damage-inducible protein DinB
VTGELANYQQRIEDLRGQMIDLVAGLPAGALNWRPIEGQGDRAANSLAGLAAHSTGAERFWVAEVVGGRPSSRDREKEFAQEAASSEEVIRWLEQTAQQTRGILSSMSDADLGETRHVEGHTLTVRWCLLHVVDHTALHLGHMQVTRQLWADGKGNPSPLWFQRLPPSDKS